MDGRTRRERLARARLYLVVTLPAPGWAARVGEALASDAIDVVQLRYPDADDDALRGALEILRPLCRRHEALLILNDRPDLAATAGADGAHVGQDDLPVAQARACLGADRLLGLSTHDVPEIQEARRAPVDYVGLGPCFATASKALDRRPAGADLLRRCLPAAGPLPVFPIGGITPANAPDLLAAGAARLAVGAGILAAPKPAGAAAALAHLLGAAPTTPADA